MTSARKSASGTVCSRGCHSRRSDFFMAPPSARCPAASQSTGSRSPPEPGKGPAAAPAHGLPTCTSGGISPRFSSQTDSDIVAQTKRSWKERTRQGPMEDPFLYAAPLGDDLVPFGYRRLRLVVLPIELGPDGRAKLVDKHQALERGCTGLKPCGSNTRAPLPSSPYWNGSTTGGSSRARTPER
jgi:hypothetical protein